MTATATPLPTKHVLSPFLAWLQTLEDGKLVADLEDERRKLAQNLRTHVERVGGKAKGSLTLTINFIDDGEDTDFVNVIAAKEPKPIRRRSTQFLQKDGTYSKNHPDQLEFGAAVVPEGTRSTGTTAL